MSRKKSNPGPVLIDDDSEVKPSPSVDATTPGSLSKLSKAILTDEQELKKAQRVHANQQSACYAYFNPPILSDAKDKNGRLMIAYPCKMCGGKTNRPIYESSPTNLAKHVASCTKKQREANSNQKLADMGVSGTGDIDPREVPQLCAIWCAQSAQPFASLGETSHLGIVHPTVIKNLPKRRTVSNDIAKLYTAVQESLIESFKNTKGAMYLGLDAWQSPNGFDVLGTVIYRLVKEEEGGFHLEAMPLDFVRLQKSHTGLYLAETVQLIVEKFGLQDKIYGIVTDNASNNRSMIEELQTFRWPHFKGEATWVVLRPFGSHKRTKTVVSDNEESDEEETEDQDNQIRLATHDSADDGDDDEDDAGSIIDDSALAAELIDDDEVELEDDDVNELSDEDEDDQYTSNSCRKTLAKFRAIARKLNKSPNSKAHFVEICQDLECVRPHNIARDVRTRWNSTLTQLSSIVRCSSAILEWQKDRRHGPSQEYYINEDDIHLARDLIEVLEPFYEITLQVSMHGAARISDIVVFIDQITSHLSTIICDKKDKYPPALRNACRAGLQLTNKYYTLTDCSPLYRVAMVLHPSFKDEYFKLAKWKPEWIQEAIRLTREMWENHYKPSPQATNSQPANQAMQDILF
ncbi:uncharacterized protein PGTG_14585 [Puccinia graminis f. sp. tritici CRL 75-36-700-3]|uniref:DUF659 domain-containing protein n=2 Tax=Puccinia graminis f. sp. tritici TaxID=56615 RepID=E3KU95_PUCGT|nr:uncharacterized protein PGTG_14585 [Puccinia graminis f. sp. tritici CRL 75-36-700-3]EFP87870.2 hypothetical protein PGTG_14585 [Puccinia graminis f. sp. tritici CRL 75-36-700-3]